MLLPQVLNGVILKLIVNFFVLYILVIFNKLLKFRCLIVRSLHLFSHSIIT
jgi:hypothetical protein